MTSSANYSFVRWMHEERSGLVFSLIYEFRIAIALMFTSEISTLFYAIVQ